MAPSSHEAALRRASAVVEVPGAPLSLQLDGVAVTRDHVRLSWSFLDPEGSPDDRRRRVRRIRGDLELAMAPGRPDGLARSWWREVQLAAAHRFKLQVDADWEPGRPHVPQVWTVEKAWEALLRHLGGDGADVRVEHGEIRVVHRGRETVWRIDPAAWAAYLTGPEAADPPGTDRSTDPAAIVPAAVPTIDGLPLWAADELFEAAGAWGPVVGLVDGKLVRLDP